MEGKPLPTPFFYFLEGDAQIAYYDNAIFVFLCMDTLNKPLDLGHDDVEGQECKDGRSRTWMLLLYEDNPVHKAVLDFRLAELDWDYCGRIHDQDGVKSHHHVVCLFKNGRKAPDVADDLGIDTRWLRAWDKKKRAMRYLCHKDNEEKFQYLPDAIYGTIAEKAIAECCKCDSISEKDSVSQIIKMLDEIEGIVTFAYFIKLVNDAGLYSAFRRMGNLGVNLINEHNGRERQRLHAEIRSESNLLAFERFMRNIDDLPFEKRCELLAERGFPPISEV